MSDVIDELAAQWRACRHLLVLTGAGLSTESGIPDVRSVATGQVRQPGCADALSLRFFQQDPAAFWSAFRTLFPFGTTGSACPDTGHRLLAQLAATDKTVTVVTQNIDGLHQRAGSPHVIEAHGSVERLVCPACLCRDHDATCQVQPVPHCHCCGEVLKPDVVLHGEPVEAMDAALAALAEADCLWVMGSSLEAGPVNQLPALARHWRMPSALVNLQPTALDSRFDLCLHRPIGEVCAKFRQILGFDSD
ncbi:NAD-dependent protein deacylase [Laribacter hongkongensis]|uniref:SIR2 family NAD-dependent protein deacylase n=1 Tax=Laribacter hongkongensis TaxID=168471 RepID=UPI001EFD8D85|nr:Sir2 family NAD-dependent protein deacetylase [Laribacter hongkongensis]MCG9053948.1 NAD-dependent protein deacylase [Laribacter hongkongensis]